MFIHLKFKKCMPHEAMKVNVHITWKPIICPKVMESCSILERWKVHICIPLFGQQTFSPNLFSCRALLRLTRWNDQKTQVENQKTLTAKKFGTEMSEF